MAGGCFPSLVGKRHQFALRGPRCLTVLPCAAAGLGRCLLNNSSRVISHCLATDAVTPPRFHCSARNCDTAVFSWRQTTAGIDDFEYEIGRGPGI